MSIRSIVVRLTVRTPHPGKQENAMEYMLLIYNSEADGKKMSQEDHQQIFQEYMTFTQDLSKSGKNKGAAPFDQTATATTVTVRNGNTVVTDGPIASTHAQLCSYYLDERQA